MHTVLKAEDVVVVFYRDGNTKLLAGFGVFAFVTEDNIFRENVAVHRDNTVIENRVEFCTRTALSYFNRGRRAGKIYGTRRTCRTFGVEANLKQHRIIGQRLSGGSGVVPNYAELSVCNIVSRDR